VPKGHVREILVQLQCLLDTGLGSNNLIDLETANGLPFEWKRCTPVELLRTAGGPVITLGWVEFRCMLAPIPGITNPCIRGGSRVLQEVFQVVNLSDFSSNLAHLDVIVSLKRMVHRGWLVDPSSPPDHLAAETGYRYNANPESAKGMLLRSYVRQDEPLTTPSRSKSGKYASNKRPEKEDKRAATTEKTEGRQRGQGTAGAETER
jgi:hypothetical protein